jgi:hypothetical protein
MKRTLPSIIKSVICTGDRKYFNTSIKTEEEAELPALGRGQDSCQSLNNNKKASGRDNIPAVYKIDNSALEIEYIIS